MKLRSSMIALFGMLLWCACKDRPRFEPEKVVRKPVVTVAPVPTRPYEDGYRAGFDSGKQQAAPHAKMPDPETLQRLAREQASGQPDRTERWERGFADGYADGFRNVVTGQK